MVRCHNRKGGGNLPKDPDSLRARLKKNYFRPSMKKLDDEDRDIEEGGMSAEDAVADLGSVDDGALGLLAKVASKVGNKKETPV